MAKQNNNAKQAFTEFANELANQDAIQQAKQNMQSGVQADPGDVRGSQYTNLSASNYQSQTGGQMSTDTGIQSDPYGDGTANTTTMIGQPVTAVRKNGNQAITHFQLADGTVLDYAQAVNSIKKGDIDNLIVQEGNMGSPIIRSKPDGITGNNLDNLPTF